MMNIVSSMKIIYVDNNIVFTKNEFDIICTLSFTINKDIFCACDIVCENKNVDITINSISSIFGTHIFTEKEISIEFCFKQNIDIDNNKIIIKNIKYYDNKMYNVIFISSKINVTKNPLTYIDTRSIYTTKQRFYQTYCTIQSIRQYIPDSFIVLFDNSIFDENQYNILYLHTDLFLNILNDDKLEYYTNINPNKSYGELIQTKYALEYIQHIPKKNMFKITGRYIINNQFNYIIYDNDINIFKKNDNVQGYDYIYTCLYKISDKNFTVYKNIINNLFEKIQKSEEFHNISYEIYFPKLIEKQLVKTLGLIENIAVRNEINWI